MLRDTGEGHHAASGVVVLAGAMAERSATRQTTALHTAVDDEVDVNTSMICAAATPTAQVSALSATQVSAAPVESAAQVSATPTRSAAQVSGALDESAAQVSADHIAQVPAAQAPRKRKHKVRGKERLERLEQAACTRKRLRTEHKWMNRYCELKNEPYNFNDADLTAIMAYHPGQPAGYRNKTELTDGKEIYNRHQ